MDLEILKEDSIVKIVSSLSSELSKSDQISRRKEVFKIAYETLLNKRCSDVYDKRCNKTLDELLMETVFFVLYRNRQHLTIKLRNKIISFAERLGDLARKDSTALETVKSLLRILLTLCDYLPQRPTEGIQKYKEPNWFPKFSAKASWFNFSLKNDNDVLMRSMMCLKGSNDSQFFPLGKMKKSATWHEGVLNAMAENPGVSISTRPSSQTLVSQDEGFVTPDDNHREQTPEPLKEKKPREIWWCTWDIVGQPPCEYKTWESLDVCPVVKEKPWDIFSSLKLSYDVMSLEKFSKGSIVPPTRHYVPLENLVDGVVSLLCGDPSASFIVLENNKFKLVEGTYTKGLMPQNLSLVLAPYLKCGETYRNLELFIRKNQCFDQIVPQVFFKWLGSYLYKWKSVLLSVVLLAPPQERMIKLRRFILRPSAHLSYLWDTVNLDGAFSVHRILDRMYSSLPLIQDEPLLSVVNTIFLKCCYQYISLFEKYISRGVCSQDIMSDNLYLSVEKVPSFLRPLSDIINNSRKTLQLLHTDPKMYLIKTEITEESKKQKCDSALPPSHIDYQEITKQHYIKFMKEKEEERIALAKKKSAQLEKIKEDIVNKRKWKELEAMEVELRERKIQDSYTKLETIKQQYLKDCVKEVEMKYEELMRDSDKKIALANWKLKRLAGEGTRSEVIKTEESENKSVREMFLKNGIDLSEENRELIATPVKVNTIEVKLPETVLEEEEGDNVLCRHEEALEFKKRMMGGDGIWKNMEEVVEEVEDPNKDHEVVDGLKIYQENRNRALEIKKKIMSSDLELDRINFDEPSEFNGLDEEERRNLENDLIVFLPPETEQTDSYIKTAYEFLNWKKTVKNITETNDEEQQFNFGTETMNFIQVSHVFLKSAKNYLMNQLQVANKIMLEHLRDDFIKEVRWISDQYLLMDGVWSVALTKKLLALIQKGSVNPLYLNRLFVPPLTVRNSDKSLLAVLDPCDPASLNHIVLTYLPREPFHHFIRERFLLLYNKCFLHVIKIDLARQHLLNSFIFLKNRHTTVPSHQYNQIHLQLMTMNHFITSLKCQIYNSFEKSWDKFYLESTRVTSLDDLNLAHIKYLKNIQVLCWQIKKLSLVQGNLASILSHIYKYCETLQAGVVSEAPDGSLTHSLYSNLSFQFSQYLVQVRKMYSILLRYVESGVSDIFSELWELLSVNNFYRLSRNLSLPV